VDTVVDFVELDIEQIASHRLDMGIVLVI